MDADLKDVEEKFHKEKLKNEEIEENYKSELKNQQNAYEDDIREMRRENDDM